MTRIASILGVATVATLVLLSGCETAVKPDYAKDLEGTWSTDLDRMIPLDLATPMVLTGVKTAVTAEVTRTGTNKGAVSLKIADTPTGAPMPIATTTVTGDIEVTATEIMVSDVAVDPLTVLTALPQELAAGLTTEGLTLTYTLSDDGSELTVGNAALFTVLLGAAEIKLTKEMASTSSR